MGGLGGLGRERRLHLLRGPALTNGKRMGCVLYLSYWQVLHLCAEPLALDQAVVDSPHLEHGGAHDHLEPVKLLERAGVAAVHIVVNSH